MTFRALGVFGLAEMAVFILLVFVAYVYVWKKGGLDWGAPVGKAEEVKQELLRDLAERREEAARAG